MKTILFIFLLGSVSLSLAQQNSAHQGAAPGCGPDKQKFDVAASRNQPVAMQPDPAKALIYIIQDDSHFESRPRPTTRVGVDGDWIGATHSDSYFQAALDPGEHHLCTSWQGFVGIGIGTRVAAMHFTAEAGKSYYFQVKDKFIRDHGPADMELAAINSDEGQLLVGKLPVSSSHPKK
jgi:hypothetical protein